jgi:hypothetical protein
MLAFDIVAEPSTHGAFPQPLGEDIIRFINSTKSMKSDGMRKELVKLIDSYFKV